MKVKEHSFLGIDEYRDDTAVEPRLIVVLQSSKTTRRNARADTPTQRAMSTRARDEHARDAPGDDRPAAQSESGVAFSPFLEPRSPPPLKPLKLHAAPSPTSGASSGAQTSPPDPPRFARLSQGSAFELHAHSEMTTNAPESTRGCGRPPQPAPRVSPERNCPRCAQLAAESAAKDVSVRALTQTLSRTRALLDAIQDLAEQQATHEQRSDSRMTSLEEKVARYRDALRSADDGETDARAESSGIRRRDIAEIDHDPSDSSRSSSVERNYTHRRRNSVGRHKVHDGSEFGFFGRGGGGDIGEARDADARC